MAIDSQHPQYSSALPDWNLMRDTYAGERKIKEKGFEYLSPTPGQIQDGLNEGQIGLKNYLAYKSRAIFPEFTSGCIETAIGVMHKKPPTIQLPAALEPLRKKATVRGESLEQLLRKINTEQLISGRIGLLADVETNAPPSVLPYIATYNAEAIINWDDGRRDEMVLQNLNLVVLAESEHERTKDFEWEFIEKYRVLVLGDPMLNEPLGEAVYRVGVFRKTDKAIEFSELSLMTPSIAGREMRKIPFVFVNHRDLIPDPEPSPMLPLARLATSVYRSEADYRQALFMQGQDTLIIIGGTSDDVVRAGAGAVIQVNQGGNAKYIGVSSTGLPEMRSALTNDRKEAAELGGRLLDVSGSDAESGEALRVRVTARTATLTQIALSGASGLEDILKLITEWKGANPDEVRVIPNTDFANQGFTGRDLLEYTQAKTLGAPISNKTIHQLLVERDVTTLSFEEELTEIENETPLAGPEPTGTGLSQPTDGVASEDADEEEGD